MADTTTHPQGVLQAFQDFKVTRVMLGFRVLQPGGLPNWLGSAWRGLLGHGLKDAVCTTGLAECRPCPLLGSCPYPVLFEAQPPKDAAILGPNVRAPGPYTLLAAPGGRVARDDELSLRLSLFGDHFGDAILLARVLALGADNGIGERRLSLSLDRMAAVEVDGSQREISLAELKESPPVILPLQKLPSCPKTVTIELLTPLRLRVNNRYLGPDRLTFGDFFSHLLRRCSLLMQFYGGGEIQLPFRELVDQARALHFSHSDLQWLDLARHSSRQKKRIPMGGVVGTLRLKDDRLPLLWPLLWLGQWTQLGKGVSMGLGEYRISFE